MASTKTKTLLISVAGLALLAISAAVLWRTVDEKARAPGARSTALERAGARPSTVAAALAAVPPPKLLLDPGLAPAERTLAGCFTALTQARQELVALEGEVRVLVPVEAFNEATPNSRLQAEVAPQIERLWPAAATSLGISYAVECRGWACGLNVVMPAEESPEVEPRLRAIGSWIPVIERLRDLRVTPPSALGIAVQWVGSRHSKDAVTGKKLDEWAFFFGAPPGTPGAGPASPVAVSPPPSADACPRELATTRARLRVRRAQLAGFRPSATLFADGQSAPELSGRMQAAVDRAGARARAECRSGICRLRFEQPPDPAALARLREDSDLGERLDKEQRNEADVYLTVREMGGPVLARLRAPVKGAGFFAGCPEPEREGNVLLRLLLPQTGMPNENGEFDHASVQAAGGSLARSPAAACLTERMAAVLSAQELPRPMAGLLRFESWSWRPGQPPRLVTPGAL